MQFPGVIRNSMWINIIGLVKEQVEIPTSTKFVSCFLVLKFQRYNMFL